MAKYKLKSLSVQINGKVYHKKDNYIFDTEKQADIKSEIDIAFKNDFLELINEPAQKIEKKEVAEIDEPKEKAKVKSKF